MLAVLSTPTFTMPPPKKSKVLCYTHWTVQGQQTCTCATKHHATTADSTHTTQHNRTRGEGCCRGTHGRCTARRKKLSQQQHTEELAVHNTA
jgi:hypothetical protein